MLRVVIGDSERWTKGRFAARAIGMDSLASWNIRGFALVQ